MDDLELLHLMLLAADGDAKARSVVQRMAAVLGEAPPQFTSDEVLEAMGALLYAGANGDEAPPLGQDPARGGQLGRLPVDVIRRLLEFVDGDPDPQDPPTLLRLRGTSRVFRNTAPFPFLIQLRARLIVGRFGLRRQREDYDPVREAVDTGNALLVRRVLLEDRTLDRSRGDVFGATPLHVAASHGHEAVVRALLGAGADKDKADNDGRTPLFAAAFNGHEAAVRALLEAGADPDKANRLEWTPLYVAVVTIKRAVARILLEAGADPNKADNFGQTPLAAAAGNGDEAMVRALLEAGADKDKANDFGRTPFDVAVTDAIRELLQ